MRVNPSSTIQVTEWICWYKPFRIQRGESYQKVYLEEWEKVDVEQSNVSGKDKSCLTAIFAESDERTTTREPPRDSSSSAKILVGSSWCI